MVSKSYRPTYERSLEQPAEFWLDAARGDLVVRPAASQALDPGRAPLYDWFPDGELNTRYNALDRHVDAGRGDQDALIYDSAITGSQRRYSYPNSRRGGHVRRRAARAGVGKGDRVVIYMPMMPEAVIAMLACARLGAVHSVVFGGFAPKELAARIDDARPKVVTASGGIEPSRVVEYLPARRRPSTGRHTGHPGLIKSRDGFAPRSPGRPRMARLGRRVASAAPAVPVAVDAPIRSTSSTRRAPPVGRRAWCGTTAATRWR